jgi:hypothetical protein
MRSFWCRTLALAGFLGAGFAMSTDVAAAAVPAADTVETEEIVAPVRLVAPVESGTLRAGTVAELAWEPLEGFGLLDGTEEWEAFLSLDGGAHYTVRITPHLDRELRRVLWRVPATPTHDARLLLRFGDEHLETAYELPQRFSITVSPEPVFETVPVRLALRRGEPALPGQAGVVAWVEGTRLGGGARQVEAAEPPSAQSRPSMADAAAERAFLEEAGGPGFDPAAAAGSARQIPPSGRRLGAPVPERTSAAAPLSILLQSRRRNE